MTFPEKREIRLLGNVEPGFEEIEDDGGLCLTLGASLLVGK